MKSKQSGLGTYILILKLEDDTLIRIGRLGNVQFRVGFYLYTGSAFNSGGLDSRLKRHLAINKKSHWHIDYLREKCSVEEIIISRAKKKLECIWADRLSRLSDYSIPGFGCSDCKCKSHLFYLKDSSGLKLIKKKLPSINEIITSCNRLHFIKTKTC